MEETMKEMVQRQIELERHLWTHCTTGLAKSEMESVSGALMRAAKRLSRLAEHECNRKLTDAERAEDARLESEVRALLAKVSPEIEVRFNGDPRGFAVMIHFPWGDHPNGFKTRPYNTWGGAEYGYGI